MVHPAVAVGFGYAESRITNAEKHHETQDLVGLT